MTLELALGLSGRILNPSDLKDRTPGSQHTPGSGPVGKPIGSWKVDGRFCSLSAYRLESMVNGWAAASGEERIDFSAEIARFGAILK